jgi:hypothetical protein
MDSAVEFEAIHFTANDAGLARAFRIALGDLVGNIAPFQDGLLERPAPCVLAGLDYDTPWTRDAAINTWNGAGLLFPRATRNTLLSVLERVQGNVRIGGQYWDAIIWASGAWAQYLYTGDREFLALALEALRNSLARCEAEEFDPALNLFRGPACYGDGIASYPDVYANTQGNSCILDWTRFNSDRVAPRGYGLPMHALSTNCLYYEAYRQAGRMADELGQTGDPAWSTKAATLKDAINWHFWMPEAGRYRYLVDPFGNCDFQEGMGHAFALLFGVADDAQAEAVLRNQHVTPSGIPCVWPSFARYTSADGMSYGRHSGTVWPQIQAFWAHAAALRGKSDVFAHELGRLVEYSNRDAQFAEIYHPLTGAIYGGLQELGDEPRHLWRSCSRQTWSATGFLRMMLMGVLGMRFEPDGVHFQPLLPPGLTHVCLQGLPYRGMRLTITVDGHGAQIARCGVNGQIERRPFVPASATGEQQVHIAMLPHA